MIWKLIQVSEIYQEYVGETGELAFTKDKKNFVFSGENFGVRGSIISYLGDPEVRCQEVWLQSDEAEFRFSYVDYEKIGDVSFCYA